MNYRLPLKTSSSDNMVNKHDYIFIASWTDGFCRRLLNYNFLVNRKFQYELEMESYEYQSSTGEKLSLFLSGRLPINIREKIEYLTTIKQLKERIASTYGIWMTDFPDCNFTIRGSKSIARTSINMVNYEKYKDSENPVESEVIKLHELLHDWIISIYEFHLKK